MSDNSWLSDVFERESIISFDDIYRWRQRMLLKDPSLKESLFPDYEMPEDYEIDDNFPTLDDVRPVLIQSNRLAWELAQKEVFPGVSVYLKFFDSRGKGYSLIVGSEIFDKYPFVQMVDLAVENISDDILVMDALTYFETGHKAFGMNFPYTFERPLILTSRDFKFGASALLDRAKMSKILAHYKMASMCVIPYSCHSALLFHPRQRDYRLCIKACEKAIQKYELKDYEILSTDVFTYAIDDPRLVLLKPEYYP